jgi:GH15 family glucan-1,4-alpha-glucosidase
MTRAERPLAEGPTFTGHPSRYPSLDEYGVIGDMRSAALVCRDGSIDWLCLPRFDSPSIFGRLLDWERGGHLRVAPDQGSVAARVYRTDSNVLETTWVAGRDQAQVIDFMPVRTARRRSTPESLRLVRMIQPLRGELDWTIDFHPAFDFARTMGRCSKPFPGRVTARGAGELVTLDYPAHFEAVPTETGTILKGRLGVGETAVVALHHGRLDAHTSGVVWQGAADLLADTDHFWRTWLQQCTYQGRYAPQVRRSALLLKLLQYQPTGAFVAAPTTSLPEAPGGSLNWDYRYTWLRDMSVLVDTLHQLGFTAEVDQFMDWLDTCCACEPAGFQMLYRVDGDPEVTECELGHLEGYRGSRPVRVGNAAADQKQLDVYGEVMEAAHAAWKRSRRMPRRRRAMLLKVVDHVVHHWDQTDAGIWESRSRPKRYLYSQAMCWLALDRALRMDSTLRLGERRRTDVRRARTRIRQQVLARGFNETLGTFTQALDDDVLDASALTVPLTGMLDASDRRVVSTVEVIQEHLVQGGLVLRHLGVESEFGQDEGAFLVCSFWLVDVLAQMGRLGAAEKLFARVSRTANDLGLFAEEFDPARHAPMGNFPLALSHLSMVGAVLNLERAARLHERATFRHPGRTERRTGRGTASTRHHLRRRR